MTKLEILKEAYGDRTTISAIPYSYDISLQEKYIKQAFRGEKGEREEGRDIVAYSWGNVCPQTIILPEGYREEERRAFRPKLTRARRHKGFL